MTYSHEYVFTTRYGRRGSIWAYSDSPLRTRDLDLQAQDSFQWAFGYWNEDYTYIGSEEQ